jgi:prepilin peptidase CpaA
MLAYLTYDLSTLLLLCGIGLAAVIDLRRHKVPNWLTAALFSSGLVLNAYFIGWSGLGGALAGSLTGLILLLPFYLKGGMGAGDVKLMAAAGTYLGFLPTLLGVSFGLLLAGIYSILLIIWRGELFDCYQRCLVMFQTGHFAEAGSDSVLKERFPFGVALAAGTVVSLAWFGLLDFYHLGNLMGSLG